MEMNGFSISSRNTIWNPKYWETYFRRQFSTLITGKGWRLTFNSETISSFLLSREPKNIEILGLKLLYEENFHESLSYLALNKLEEIVGKQRCCLFLNNFHFSLPLDLHMPQMYDLCCTFKGIFVPMDNFFFQLSNDNARNDEKTYKLLLL